MTANFTRRLRLKRLSVLKLCAKVLAVTAIGGLTTGCGAVLRPDGGSGMLPERKAAPRLTGIDQNGALRSIDQARGTYLVVYFYPMDDTPGCTAEACAFRDVWDRYTAENVMVYGVSRDDRQSHAEFAKEYQLEFPLIADPGGIWADAFGVGSFLGMNSRVSFLIGPTGTVEKSYPDVDPGLHATAILDDIRRLRKTAP